MRKKIVIVGGIAAGTSAAAKARRCDENAEIVLFKQDALISYSTCGMPYYLSGVIDNRDSLLVLDHDDFIKQFNVRVGLNHRVEAIHPEQKEVKVRNLEKDQVFNESYDSLVICTGSRPMIPKFPGMDLPFVFTMRSIEDTDRIFKFLEERKPKYACVLGGGLIGMEMLECLHRRGIVVGMMEMLDHVLPFLDWDMAQYVQKHMKEKGVRLLLSHTVQSIEPSADGTGEVVIENGQRIHCEMMILALGVRPEVELAKKAGVKIGPTGAIAIDDEMRTSIPDIYAAGDCAESMNLITGKPSYLAMGSKANKEGRVAGANAAGRHLKVKGFCNTIIVKAFDMAAGRTGVNQLEALREGMDTIVHYIHPTDYSKYYPGSNPIHIKVISCKKTGRLLGAQVVGRDGVDKRLDVFATALYNGMKTEDLIHLDLAYAPPFSPARDAIIVTGATGQTLFSQDWQPILAAELKERINGNNNLCIVDVRGIEDVRKTGVIAGAIQIPISDLRKRMGELNPEIETIVYCRQGLRGYIAARMLTLNGFKNVKNLTGGALSWHYGFEKVDGD